MYINSSTEEMLKMVKVHRHLNVSEVVEPEQFKRKETREKLRLWHNKKLHGQVLKEMEKADLANSWLWQSKGDVKRCTEALQH